MCADTLPISIDGAAASSPNLSARRISRATFATLSSVLLGTQPVYRQSPPGRSRSTSATRTPSFAASGAASSPAETGANHDEVVRFAHVAILICAKRLSRFVSERHYRRDTTT